MTKENNTAHYSAKQIEAKIAQGEDRTDWCKANSMTGKILDASIQNDPDDLLNEPEWGHAVIGMPASKLTTM